MDELEGFFARYLACMFIGFPLALIAVVAIVKTTGMGGNASSAIGLLGGVMLLSVSAFLTSR